MTLNFIPKSVFLILVKEGLTFKYKQLFQFILKRKNSWRKVIEYEG